MLTTKPKLDKKQEMKAAKGKENKNLLIFVRILKDHLNLTGFYLCTETSR